MSLALPFSHAPVDPAPENPTCFMCGHRIVRRASIRGFEMFKGRRLYIHESCLSANTVPELWMKYQASLADIDRDGGLSP